ncbi:MAG: TIGR00282 family metallophosphoesterase [Aestuariivita sp.]|nr:TIGR00282 family metallophosphoesterase [Aestuariivita sp.]
MRILFLGDVMGKVGRLMIGQELSKLKRDWQIDFTIINGENATNGMGLSRDHAAGFFNAGADCVTLGDHAFDQKEMQQVIEDEQRILRPINFARTAPGRGFKVFEVRDGRKILVAQVLGQLFMRRPFDNPFVALEPVFEAYHLGGFVNAIVVDMHCEATSEKMAMGHYCDGRASLVVGTHTHVPTADAMILPGGTAYLTDAGMCGDYNSIIGMRIEEPIQRFVNGMSKGRLTPALGVASLSGVVVEINDQTGLAMSIERISMGGCFDRVSMNGAQ